MKNRKVLNLRTHVAGVLGINSYDHEKHRAQMEVTAVGVLVNRISRGGKLEQVNVLIPFANIIEVVLGDEVDENKKPSAA